MIRIPKFVWLSVSAVLLLSACFSTGETSGEFGSTSLEPDWIPDGLSLRGGCFREKEGRIGLTVLSYRGDGRYKSEVDPIRVESAFLRIFAIDFEAEVEF